MKYSEIPLAQTITALCKAKGINHIVISPGSRNAPLTIGFTHDPYFTCYSIVDERCAAFFALGIAQKIQHPVAVVCTSGSALLNYYPAVAEAFYSDIPLIVLSADRPKHLVGIGDGQTIYQKEVYGSHVLYNANLKLDLRDSDNKSKEDIPILKSIENKLEMFLGLKQDIQDDNALQINQALNTAILEKGPVHINCPFDEPLYQMVDEPIVTPKAIESKKEIVNIDSDTIQSLINTWNSADRKMVLVGVNSPHNIDKKWLEFLANDDSVLVFTETTSNLHHNEFFPSIDQIIAPLTEDEIKTLQPDVLVTFGGMVVSKKIKAFLRTYKPKHHWHIDEKKAYDTYFSLSEHLKVKPNSFFEQFLPKSSKKESNYKSYWTSVREKRVSKHNSYLDTIGFSDFIAFSTILKSIPDSTVLQVSNSSTVRYLQLFQLNPTLKVFCNRGTSGIDGSTSTAIGYAVASQEPTVFITGDLSFFYDSNALWNNYIPSTFRIIVINNQGGGIFRILPGHKNTENFDQYFETKHQLNAADLCNMYSIEYNSVKAQDDLEKALEVFYNESERPKLLEVFTPSEVNDEILLSYFKYIA